MMILIGTLLFALAVFPNSIETSSPPKSPGSPVRVPDMTHVPSEGPSISGRGSNKNIFDIEEELSSLMEEFYSLKSDFRVEINHAGVFYKDSGQLILVHPGIPLVRNRGFTIGIAVEGIVWPIYNNREQQIVTSDKKLIVQAVVNAVEARQLGVWGPVPTENTQTTSSPARMIGNRRRQNRRKY